MADNYLETRYEEVFGAGAKSKNIVKRVNVSLNTLLVKNRSTRRYRQDAHVSPEQLRTIVEVNTKLASAMNRQVLRFRIVTDNVTVGNTTADATGRAVVDAAVNAVENATENATGNVADCAAGRIAEEAKFAICSDADLLRTVLFREQMIPESANAFIIVYSVIPEDRYVDMDLGISLQSMSLKAVEMGFNCLIKGNIDSAKISSLFDGAETDVQLHPLAVLCIGKSAESIYLKPTDDASELEPYTKEGVHYVPKLQIDSLLL